MRLGTSSAKPLLLVRVCPISGRHFHFVQRLRLWCAFFVFSDSLLSSNAFDPVISQKLNHIYCILWHEAAALKPFLPRSECNLFDAIHSVDGQGSPVKSRQEICQMAFSNPSSAPNSFPTPPHTAGSTTAPSVISSRMTDIASEDNDEFKTEGLGDARRSTVSGRPSGDQSRPPSARSSQTRSWTQSSPPRRGNPSPGAMGNNRRGGAFGGPGGTTTNTSRQPTTMSSGSRTHVPSLASQAFFHPMSSQRLQAQRAGRPNVYQQPVQHADDESEIGSTVNRQSFESNVTAHQGATTQQGPLIHEDNDFPPPSRGTEFSEPDDRGTVTASPTGNATLRSVGDSERPLQDRSSNPRPNRLDLGKNYKQGNGGVPPIKSPRSFRTNFRSPAKGGAPHNDNQGRERLSSSTSSPRPGRIKEDLNASPRAEFNYQYFTGNTVFCWGGRLQNTKGRPINIATGILVVLPSVLFLAYS